MFIDVKPRTARSLSCWIIAVSADLDRLYIVLQTPSLMASHVLTSERVFRQRGIQYAMQMETVSRA